MKDQQNRGSKRADRIEPKLWLGGLQRLMSDLFGRRDRAKQLMGQGEGYYQGTADPRRVAKRRARNKLATRSRTNQSMARRGK